MNDNEIIAAIKRIQQEADRSKYLAILAILGYDDGRIYSAQEHCAAAEWLRKGHPPRTASEKECLERALQWLSAHSSSTEPMLC